MVQFMDKNRPATVAEPVARAGAAASQSPWHIWVVGVVSLLWNCFGAFDYTMSQLRSESYLGAAAESMNVTAAEMIAFIDSFPAWMHAFWALGVWGALAGSVLLLMRSRYAVWAFAVSLTGLAVTQIYQATTPQPEWMATSAGMTIVIWSVATFLLIYAVSIRKNGLLR